MSRLTKADVKWLLVFVQNYEDLLEQYPELFKQDDIDDIKVARQILEELL